MPFDGTDNPKFETLEKLNKVIELLDSPEKWCKGGFSRPDGEFCIRGAIRFVDVGIDFWHGGAVQSPLQNELEPVILQAIHQCGFRKFHRIEGFNDHPDTNHADVMKVLHKAREILITPPAAKPARSKFLFWFRK